LLHIKELSGVIHLTAFEGEIRWNEMDEFLDEKEDLIEKMGAYFSTSNQINNNDIKLL
jgi:hypothetical protein